MNLRNKRKVSSSTSDEGDHQFNPNDQTATTAHSIGSINPSPKKQIIPTNSNPNNQTINDSILTSTQNATKKLKTNSGSGYPQPHTNHLSTNNICVKSAEQIIQHQQSINNDCDIDCDGFREIYPDYLHTELQEAILTEQTIVLRNAAGLEGYNVNPKNLFGFESVIKNHGEMEIECRIQNPTVYGYNVENSKNQQHIYHTSIGEYGEYAQLIEDDKYDEIMKKQYYKDHFVKLSSGVMFAVNIDMDDINWKQENMRLRSSLPHYLLNKGKHDILSYHRQNVMGCTQPQMYLKVAGVWTGGHQENISVRAININHGDGESDWYCIDYNQVEKYRNFIKKKYSIDIHTNEGLWFGKYNDPEVIKAGIKIKKVIQRKNDIVILAPGVLHWVRCRGKSVQTAWNFAYRRLEDIVAMNDRFLYNQKINFQTIILNKVLFMDLLNFEYHNLPIEVSEKLYSIVQEYYQKEISLENTLLNSPLKIKNDVTFYEQLPAQLRHIQIYYCSEQDCAKEIFCYFGVLRSQFLFQDSQKEYQNEFCGKYFCPQCLIDMKKVEDQIILFRKFDLNSLKTLLQRVINYIHKRGFTQPLYPIADLSNVGHFCGQIQNINDFIFNKDVRRLEQVYIPDVYTKQGVEEMQKFQLDLQADKLIGFNEKPILKYVTSTHSQRCEDIGSDIINPEIATIMNIEPTIKKEEQPQKLIKTSLNENGNLQEGQDLKSKQNGSKPQQGNAQKNQENGSKAKQTGNKQIENEPQTQETENDANHNTAQNSDEKLAIQLQQIEISQVQRTTRQQKNNPQQMIDPILKTRSQAITTLKAGKSMCSRPKTNQALKKQNPSSIQTQSQTSAQTLPLKESTQVTDVNSPTSYSIETNSNANQNSEATSTKNSNNGSMNSIIASPFLNGQQIVKAKKKTNESENQVQQSPSLNAKLEEPMQIEEVPLTPKKQISYEEQNQTGQQSASKMNANFKIITTNGSSTKNQENKNQVQIQKSKIMSNADDDDDDDDEDEQEKLIKKQRQKQRLSYEQAFESKKEEFLEMRLRSQQREISNTQQQEQYQNKERAISPSSENDDNHMLFKKKLTLKHIA